MTQLQSSAKQWAREYETVYILRPNVTSDDAEKVASRVREVLERMNAKLTLVETWGKKQLAYAIRKHNRGIFIYLKYVGYSDVVAELERNLRIVEEVLRYQTVVINEQVDLDSVSAEADATAFEAIEESEEEEQQEDLATRLGLAALEARDAARRAARQAAAEAAQNAAAAEAEGNEEGEPSEDAEAASASNEEAASEDEHAAAESGTTEETEG